MFCYFVVPHSVASGLWHLLLVGKTGHWFWVVLDPLSKVMNRVITTVEFIYIFCIGMFHNLLNFQLVIEL